MEYKRSPNHWRFMPLSGKLLLLAALSIAVFSMVSTIQLFVDTYITNIMPQVVLLSLVIIRYISLTFAITLLICVAFSPVFPKSRYITRLVKRALFDPSRGNPLHLKEVRLYNNNGNKTP